MHKLFSRRGSYCSVFIKCFLLFFLLNFAVRIEKVYSVNICDNVECEPLIECPKGQVKTKVGYHRCCDSCVTKADNVKSACQKAQDIRLKHLKENDKYADNLWIPACEENGSYKLKQTKAKKTVCVNNDGSKLFGQDISEMSPNMSCKCSQHMHHLKIQKKDTFMTKPQEHCTASGNYEKIQCIENLCYCADTETGEVQGRIVRLDHIDKLPCYEKKKSMTSYLQPCEKELIRARTLRRQFSLKGINVLGLETVECDPDGTFSPTQCHSNRCSCTNEEGFEIRSFFTEEVFRYTKMECGCARDNEKAAMHAQYPALKCDKYGNYNFTQCIRHGECFCVDKDGDVISKDISFEELDAARETFCEELLNNLTTKDTEQGNDYSIQPSSSTENDKRAVLKQQ